MRMRRRTLAVVVVLTVLAGGLTATATLPFGAGAAPAAGDEATMGAWSAPFTPPGANPRVIGVHAVMMHTGKVLIFGNLRPTQGYVYDPETGRATNADPPVDVECGAVTPLADGRLLVVGGHGRGATGITNILLFDPETETWIPQPSSPLGRYYPTTTRLPDGRILITGGFTVTGAKNPNVEVYTPPPPGGSVGTLEVVGQHNVGLYPHQWVLPDGRVLEVTSRAAWMLNPSTWTWTALARQKVKHGSGEGAVLLPGSPAGSTEVMHIGGGGSASAIATTESYDAAAPAAGWRLRASLPQPRSHLNPVLLPDNTVLGLGGNSSGLYNHPHFTALRYNPQANDWTTLAAQVKRRAYHSTAVLLPDGRVLSAGDTGAGGGRNTNELYSPPYLFQGPRPAITSAPSRVDHGESFTIRTPDPSSRAVLIAPGASTHTLDMNQRIVELRVSQDAGDIKAVAPSRNVGIAGWYMLFLVNGAGVPSTATWIHVG